MRFSQRQKSPFWDRRRFLDYNIQRYIREQIMGRYIPERKLSLILENKTIKFVSQEEDVYIKKNVKMLIMTIEL